MAAVIFDVSRPGGNITGFSLNASDLSATRVEFARACIPDALHIAVVGNMSNDSVLLKAKSIAEASAVYRIDTKRFDFFGPSAMSGVLLSVRDWKADVILTTEDAVVVANRDISSSLRQSTGSRSCRNLRSWRKLVRF